MTARFNVLPGEINVARLVPVSLDFRDYGTLNVGDKIYAIGEDPVTYLGKYPGEDPRKDILIFEGDFDTYYIKRLDFADLVFARRILFQRVEEV